MCVLARDSEYLMTNMNIVAMNKYSFLPHSYTIKNVGGPTHIYIYIYSMLYHYRHIIIV